MKTEYNSGWSIYGFSLIFLSGISIVISVQPDDESHFKVVFQVVFFLGALFVLFFFLKTFIRIRLTIDHLKVLNFAGQQKAIIWYADIAHLGTAKDYQLISKSRLQHENSDKALFIYLKNGESYIISDSEINDFEEFIATLKQHLPQKDR